MLHDLMFLKGIRIKRPVLLANSKQMLDFLLAHVYVLEHIPSHLLHVFALLWASSVLDIYAAGA